MKKKLIPLILALVCAVACVFGLAACGDDGEKDVIGVCLSTAANPTEKQSSANLGSYVYGEDDKINDALVNSVKFYKQFRNNTYKEVAESELTVKYQKDGETLSEKPVKYTASKYGGESSYTYTYSIDGAANTCSVTFAVARATSEDFTVTLSKNTWRYGENAATVTVKNPAGAVMGLVDVSGGYKENDTDYVALQLFAMKKTDYLQGGAAVKSYSALTIKENDETQPNYGYNKYFGKTLLEYMQNYDNSNIKPGEYVLIACISNTQNYKEIVCTTEFTVTAQDTPFGKTFVLTDLTATPNGGNNLPDEIINMAESLKEGNLGKTVVAASDGKVTGTCDFGAGEFSELTGDDAFTLTFGKQADEYSTANPFYVLVKNGYDDQNRVLLEGEYKNGILTLSIQQQTDSDPIVSYYFNFTFALQSAN